eukprot:jgi/Orpsp1_1/1176882/evm.model.c7180000059382.1
METSIVIPSNISINKSSKNQEIQKEIENGINDSPPKEDIQKSEYENFHLANLYEQTSQYRHWLFTKEELDEIREEVNKEVIVEISENMKKDWEYQKQINNNIKPLKPVNFITVEDQKKLALFYESKIYDYCKILKFNDNVLVSSIVYFKRFYLYCSMMQYAPKNILLTCLFLACKSENSYISIDALLKNVPKNPPSPETIKELELIISQNIRFEYQIQSPFWALYGFYLDIQAFLNGPDKNSVNLEDNNQYKLYQTFLKSREYINISLYGDLLFLYWPSKIALACLRIASKNYSFIEDLESYIESLVKDQSNEKAEEFRKDLNEIEKSIMQYVKIEKPVAAVIEKKRQNCQDPAFNPKSIL